MALAAMRNVLVRTSATAQRATLASASTVGQRGYHENVVDHYDNPRNVGSFNKNDANVGTGLVGAPACGDVMKLQLRVDDDGRIIESCFKTFGCGSAIASSSVATEWTKGKHIDEVLTIKNSDIARHLNLPPVKLHCSMLAEDAIKAAVKDFQAKRSAKSGAKQEGEQKLQAAVA
jgi:Fe-S cluster assembly scaffold IscU